MIDRKSDDARSLAALFSDFESGQDVASYEDVIDVLDQNVNGRMYSDEELVGKFRQGLAKLESNGDFDAVMSNMNEHAWEERSMVVWKALEAEGVMVDNLTGRQLLHIYDIITYNPFKEAADEDKKS